MKYYFTAREFLTPLGIMLFLSVIQGACGCDTISYYSLKIFRMARVAMDEYVMAILLQLGYTAGYMLISPVMEKINRKLFHRCLWFDDCSLIDIGFKYAKRR